MKDRPADHLKMLDPPNILGRPIVGGINFPTNKLSNLMDLIPQQLHGSNTKTTRFQSKKLRKGLFLLLGDASSECRL